MDDLKPERSLGEFFKDQEESIAGDFCEVVFQTYPQNAQNFLKNQRDNFRNPVGQTVRSSVAVIVQSLLRETAPEDFKPALENLVRIRSVQEFSPSRALAFIFELKQIIRRRKPESGSLEIYLKHAAVLDDRIDRLALSAFDIYMQCREKLFEIRKNELERRYFKLLHGNRENLQRKPESESHAENL